MEFGIPRRRYDYEMRIDSNENIFLIDMPWYICQNQSSGKLGELGGGGGVLGKETINGCEPHIW